MTLSIKTFYCIFTNREWAIVLLIACLVIFVVLKTPKSVYQIIRCAFAPKLVVLFGSGIVYQIIMVYILYKFGFWNADLLKETIFFIITSTIIIGRSTQFDKHNV